MKRAAFALLALAVAVPAFAAEGSDSASTMSPSSPQSATGEAAAPAKTMGKAASATTKPSLKDKAVQMIEAQIAAAKVDKTKPDWRTSLPKPQLATFDSTHTYWAHMKTNKGMITIKFLPDVAPMHVTNFIYLTKLGFYDGLSFHRVIPNFMAQGGCPLGTGTGGPGYHFDGEFSPKARHNRGGMLSMANAGPGTDGSQFFLTFVATPWLDGKHSIFGEVTGGMDVLKALEADGSPSGKTREPLKMEKVTIEVK
jgi:peptidyl-prolyl cis-trans isomerase B (cyclophilin B)